MNKDYPKDYRKNLTWRTNLLVKAKKDKEFQEIVRRLFFEDPLFAFNAFFYTLDVRRRPEHHQPFCTYTYQDDMILDVIKHIEEGKDLLVEKTRDMGVSWIVILIYLWFWLNPEGGYDFLVGSRIEDYVDKKGDMRTLVQKARYAFYRLPSWLRPIHFNPKQHDNYMKLFNPDTGATITGESNNPNFSTGGRYASVLFDEFAKWESTDESAWTAAGDATPCRIAVSTPNGAGGQYYSLVTGGTVDKLRLHWSVHPRKNEGLCCSWPLEDSGEIKLRSEWYDRECARRKPLEIAQELDIDYIGAGNPAFEGKALQRIKVLLGVERKPVAFFEPNLSLARLDQLPYAPRDWDGIFICWQLPDPAQEYAIGVDIAEGKENGDFSVVKVISRESLDVVGSYFSRIDEVQLASVVAGISKLYVEPWVGIETIGPGLATFDICVTLHGMTNLFMMQQFDSALQKPTFKKGWRTSEASRKVLVSGIREWLLEADAWCDGRLLSEMTSFVRNKNGKPEAKEGCYDDEVLAFGIALQVHYGVPTREEMGISKAIEREEFFDMGKLKTEEKPLSLEERCLIFLEERKVDEVFIEDSFEFIFVEEFL